MKTIEIFAWSFPVKLNYESIEDREGGGGNLCSS